MAYTQKDPQLTFRMKKLAEITQRPYAGVTSDPFTDPAIMALPECWFITGGWPVGVVPYKLCEKVDDSFNCIGSGTKLAVYAEINTLLGYAGKRVNWFGYKRHDVLMKADVINFKPSSPQATII